MKLTCCLRRMEYFAVCLLLLMLTVSCAGPPEASELSLINNPNEHAPLAGILSFKSDKPVQASLLIDDGNNPFSVTPSSDFKTDHNIPVLGLHPGTQYKVTATIRDGDGRETQLPVQEFTTPPLPDDFPKFELTKTGEGTLEPGVTLINTFRWSGQFQDDPDWGIVFAVDENGEVVWYYKQDYFLGEARRMFNGNILVAGHEDGRLYEIDMLGNILKEWHSTGAMIGDAPETSIGVNTDTFHHDVIQVASGNFIGLGLEVRRDEDFPLDYPPGTKRGPANLACDVIVEFKPDGEIVREHHLADIVDPERLGDGSLSNGFYQSIYKDRFDSLEIPIDITHANALFYIEEEDALLVSINHLCAIIKINMESGELLWILGEDTGWNEVLSEKLLTPVGDLTWPCHQHGIEMTSNGTLLMYDNGAGRFVPPNKPMPVGERYSRAVEYRIDETAGTVEEVWSYGPDQELFASPFISDADQLPETGNILIADGGRFMDPEGNPMQNWGGHQWARVLEVTRDENPKKLWEVTILDPEVRYSVYRAQRFKSLYPKLDRPTG